MTQALYAHMNKKKKKDAPFKIKFRAGSVATVVEHLPALNSSTSTAKK
jgi:hypothetical protein